MCPGNASPTGDASALDGWVEDVAEERDLLDFDLDFRCFFVKDGAEEGVSDSVLNGCDCEACKAGGERRESEPPPLFELCPEVFRRV